MTDGQHKRRADVVLFVNGLPLAVLELKNPADEAATIWTAFNQLQTYKQEVPALFAYNEALVVSDGLEARMGTLTAQRERFVPWRTVTGEDLAPTSVPQLQVLLEGVFEKRRFLDLVRHFTVFEDDASGNVAKKTAGYHQFHAVNWALEQTLRAATALSAKKVAEPLGHYEDDARGALKVVMTGSASDPVDWQPHVRNKPRRETLASISRTPRIRSNRDRARHVAHGLRRPVPAHDVCRQAHARPRPDAGDRTRKPRLQGQARRAGRGLPRDGR